MDQNRFETDVLVPERNGIITKKNTIICRIANWFQLSLLAKRQVMILHTQKHILIWLIKQKDK